MAKNTEDKRVRHTKKYLREALLRLMENKPIAKITPTELCREADINRNTFYSHYSSVAEIMAEIEDELSKEILSCVSGNIGTELNLGELCRAVKARGELCRVILSENGDRDFLQKIIASVRDMTVDSWKNLAPEASTEELQFYFDYCANGSVFNIYHWIDSGMNCSSEVIAEMLEKANGAVMAAFFKRH